MQMTAEAAGKVEQVDAVEVDAVGGEDYVQPGNVGALGLRQLVHIALKKVNAPSFRFVFVENNSRRTLIKAAHLIHTLRAQQLAQQIHEAGTADAFGLRLADHAQLKCAVVRDFYFFNGAVERRHTTSDGSAREGGTGRAGRGQNAVPVADNQLRVGADIHHRNQPLFVSQVHG